MTATALLFLVFLAFCVAGAGISLTIPDRWNPPALACVASLSSIVLLAMSIVVLISGEPVQIALWRVVPMGTLTLDLDQLSALFTAITAVVYLAGSVFAASYIGRSTQRYGNRSFIALHHLLYASLVLVLAAGDVLLLLLAWEIMSVLIYLLVNYGQGQAQRASYLMLALSEAGTIAIAIGLLVAVHASATMSFPAVRDAAAGLGVGARWAVFLLTFFGFGVKAGLVPVNAWLPRAYAASPGAFAPLFAGATLNMGIYGIVRVNADLVPQVMAGPGLVALVVGTATALIGILYATTANDMKTMLAHSSIENAGVITVALGAGFVFTATGHAAVAAIAFIAALYHTINHSVYKTLLFTGAVAVDGTLGTRDMDRMGGLIKRMPWTAAFFLVGALSIAAMPPLNGFVSEWLTLQALLRGVVLEANFQKVVFAACGAGLALTAALAVTCFVKAFSMGFLGMARSEAARRASEVPRSVKLSMAGLAAVCVLLGILPTYVVPVLDKAVSPLTHASATTALVPNFFAAGSESSELPPSFVADFHQIGAQVGSGVVPGRGLVILHRGGERNPVVFAMSTSWMDVVLAGLLGLLYGAVRVTTGSRSVVRRPRWDGGVRHFLPEMTYTATGFSNPVRVIFNAMFRPTMVEDTRDTVAEHFRTAIRREYQATHVVDRYVLFPVVAAIEWLAGMLARMHNGRINAYSAYVFLTLLLLLAIARF